MAKVKPTLNEADLKLLEGKFLTKRDAEDFLKKKDVRDFLTKKDAEDFLKKKDAKDFATKHYVANAISDAKEEILEEQRKFRSEFFDRIDPILKEVAANREERTIMAHYITELRERVERIEKRLGMAA